MESAQRSEQTGCWTTGAARIFGASVLLFLVGLASWQGWCQSRGTSAWSGVGRAISVLESDGEGERGTRDASSGSIIDGRLDLNRADLAQLELLPGVGPATAARIVAYREQIGGFRTVDELSGVRGIGPRTMERLRERVMVRAGVPVERSVP
ncbi:MAG: helix-hairpin-helix domain-containing protein, partial [Phycisphaeraceae bacterium]|nr:helix-hairpin-helix domain-containing protein [Phycisphaeraceae bacterium]